MFYVKNINLFVFVDNWTARWIPGARLTHPKWLQVILRDLKAVKICIFGVVFYHDMIVVQIYTSAAIQSTWNDHTPTSANTRHVQKIKNCVKERWTASLLGCKIFWSHHTRWRNPRKSKQNSLRLKIFCKRRNTEEKNFGNKYLLS